MFAGAIRPRTEASFANRFHQRPVVVSFHHVFRPIVGDNHNPGHQFLFVNLRRECQG